MRTGVAVSLVCAAVLGHYRGVELLAKFAPQAGQAALGFTGRGEGIVAMATATVRLPWSGL